MATATKKRTSSKKSSSSKSTSSTSSESKPKSLQDRYAGWPKKGGQDQPQPWDNEALQINPAEVAPGEKDTVSPVSTDHGRPLLTSGSQGEDVRELAQLLGELGYETSVTRGENAFNILDNSVLQAVEQFRQEYGVEEAPDAFGGNTPAGRTLAATHVGPYTWAALLRVAERERDKA